MQFSAVLNIFIVKTSLNSIFTNDLKRKDFFSKNVHSYRPSLFKLPYVIKISVLSIFEWPFTQVLLYCTLYNTYSLF